MTTTEAITEDQVTVLNTARENPSLDPGEIADKLDSHINRQYVTKILDNFHLPNEKDNPESEAAKRMDKTVHEGVVVIDADELSKDNVRWRCSLCDEYKDRKGQVTKHIRESDDSKHINKTEDINHYVKAVGPNSEAINRINDRVGPGIPDSLTLEFIYRILARPGATQSEIVEGLNVSTGTLSNRLDDIGVTWATRVQEVEDILDKCNIKFPEMDADEIFETKVGNRSYKGPAIGAPQNITERPHKGKPEESEIQEDESYVVEVDKMIDVELSVKNLTHIIQKSDEDVAQEIVEQLIE